MPTSSTRISEARGFTLVEVLATLAIMAILAGLAALAVGGGAQRQARDEAGRLHALLGHASEEATLAGEEFGLALASDGYRFLRFDADSESWQPAPGRDLAPHQLPGSVRLDADVEQAQRLPAAARAAEGLAQDAVAGPNDPEPLPAPGILVLSSGEISPFRITFSVRDAGAPAARLTSDGSGRVAYE